MDDAALVAAARTGDRDAWGLIYDRYADRLHDHCWSILRDEHEAGDALHDAFVKAAGALGQLRDPSRLRPWLYAIARNEAFRRHRARARVVPTDDLGADLGDEDGEFGTVSVDLGEGSGVPVDDLRSLVWDAAGGLSADDQALLDLHLRQGLEGEDLAEAMGITANNAYVKLSRLRDTLERSLGALLVARTGSRDCADLAALIADWDGQMSPLLRKRIARHIDGCDICDERKRTMVSPLALLAGVPMLPAPALLRDRILDDAATISSHAPVAPPSDPPPPTTATPVVAAAGAGDGRKSWPWWLAGAAAVLVAVLLAVTFLGGEGDAEVAADATTTTVGSTTTSSSTTSSTSSTTSTTSTSTTSTTLPVAAPGVITISGGSIDLGASDAAGTFVVENTGGTAISYVLTSSNALVRATILTGTLEPGQRRTVSLRFDRAAAPEGPFVHRINVDAGAAGEGVVTITGTVAPRPPEIDSVTSSETDIQTTCNPDNDATTITATFFDESAVTARIVYTSAANGGDDVDMEVNGGTAIGELGNFATADTVTYRVVITDVFGATTTSAAQTLPVLPCPG